MRALGAGHGAAAANMAFVHRRLGRTLEHLAPPATSPPCAAAASSDDDEAAAIRAFHAEGTARALALDNRGPLRFGADGRVAEEIIESYYEHGVYILEGCVAPAAASSRFSSPLGSLLCGRFFLHSVITGQELLDVTREVEQLIDNAPAGGE